MSTNTSSNNKEKPIELKDIIAQQKKASIVRVDILFEVLQMAKREGIPVVGSAFEADHQLVSLMNQNIIDFVLTNDGDIPFQGCSHTLLDESILRYCKMSSNHESCNSRGFKGDV